MSAALWIASESIDPDPDIKNATNLMIITNEFPSSAVRTVRAEVGPAIGLKTAHGVVVHGRVDDLAAHYAAADLCINPVRHGGGLKIKTVEALAHGRPLVASLHGVRSLEVHKGRAFLVADDGAAFAAAIQHLVAHPDEALRLAQAGSALAAAQFGPEACYGPLLRTLRGH